MIFTKNSLDVNKCFHIIAFTLLLLILPTAFLHEKTGRVIFYWCGYISLAGLICGYFTKKISFKKYSVALPFFVLCILFTSWSALSHYISGERTSELLFTPAKRWLIASVIAYYILNTLNLTPRRCISKSIITSMTIAFIAASCFGIIQGINSGERILLGINRATLTAYAYSAFALALSSLIAHTFTTRYKYLLQSLVLVISTYVIFLTQTRAAIFLHPLLGMLLLVVCMYKDKLLNIKVLAIAAFSLAAVVLVSHNILINRFESTVTEVQAYSGGNDNTSLGARFSMWKLGIIAFKTAPFGQSESHRNEVITNYLHAENKTSAATEFLEVHLHNEFIQYASVFGVFGIAILILFFGMLMFRVSKPALIGPVAISALSILLYGATDVLLSSIELIVIFSTTVTLSFIVMLLAKESEVSA